MNDHCDICGEPLKEGKQNGHAQGLGFYACQACILPLWERIKAETGKGVWETDAGVVRPFIQAAAIEHGRTAQSRHIVTHWPDVLTESDCAPAANGRGVYIQWCDVCGAFSGSCHSWGPFTLCLEHEHLFTDTPGYDEAQHNIRAKEGEGLKIKDRYFMRLAEAVDAEAEPYVKARAEARRKRDIARRLPLVELN